MFRDEANNLVLPFLGWSLSWTHIVAGFCVCVMLPFFFIVQRHRVIRSNEKISQHYFYVFVPVCLLLLLFLVWTSSIIVCCYCCCIVVLKLLHPRITTAAWYHLSFDIPLSRTFETQNWFRKRKRRIRIRRIFIQKR